MSTAARILDHLGTLEVRQGPLRGQPLPIIPWQRRFIRGAFAPGVSTAALTVARANGKSTICGAISDAHLRGPVAEPLAEVVICAASLTQARLIFESVLWFGADTYGRRADYRVNNTEQKALIENRKTGSRVRAIGSDPRKAHGLQAKVVLMDEPAQWGPQADAMLAALVTGDGKLDDQRAIALGTRPADPEHWFSKWLDGGADYSQIHAARPNDPPFQLRTWRRANPSLGHLPALEGAIRAAAAKAKRDPAMLASFRALKLNMGTSDVREAHVVEAERWAAIEGDAPATGRYVMGIDLGGTAAMSAAAAYWPASGRLDVIALFPGIPSLAERGIRDGVGNLYQTMEARDELRQSGEHVTRVEDLFDWALERWGPPSAVVSDRWREGELRDALSRARFPFCPLELRGQGFRDGAEDVRAFREAALTDGALVPAESLLLRSAMAEARTVADPAGNEKLSKSTQGGRRVRARDDAAAAAILAVASGWRSARNTPATGASHVVVRAS